MLSAFPFGKTRIFEPYLRNSFEISLPIPNVTFNIALIKSDARKIVKNARNFCVLLPLIDDFMILTNINDVLVRESTRCLISRHIFQDL